MEKIKLYRYVRPDGGITVSVDEPKGVEYTLEYRLFADEGKILVNGDIRVECVDTKSIEEWKEEDK